MNEKKLILYGAGCVGKLTAEKLNQFKMPFECLCDSDPQKQGLELFGHVVKSREEVKTQYKKGEYCVFISMAAENAKIAKAELIKQEVFDASDFFVGDLDKLLMDLLRYEKNAHGTERQHCIDAVSKNFISLDSAQDTELRAFLATKLNGEYIKTEAGQKDFSDHLYRRLEIYRTRIIPWLESLHTLKGANVLEIGCGSGASTVALCEQGAHVVAIDVTEWAIETAGKRLALYGLEAEIYNLNSTDIKNKFHNHFDFIIYGASMEHMTHIERIQTIRAAYDMLGKDNYIVLADTPNRLWHRDNHTSRESFYHWLPDQLAVDYAKFTSRENFNDAFTGNQEDDLLKLARFGRGVSYHEFEVAVGRGNLEVASYLNDFFDLSDSVFKMLLKIHGPAHINDGFYESALNLALQKVR